MRQIGSEMVNVTRKIGLKLVMAGLAATTVWGIGSPAWSVTIDEAMSGAVSGSEYGIEALHKYLESSQGGATAIEARAGDLIKALSSNPLMSDPFKMQEAADRIIDAATQSLNSLLVVPLFLGESITLPPGSFAYDFGPADLDSQIGFEKVAPDDERVTGDFMWAARPLNGESTTTSGIHGVRTFKMNVPNGRYRLILIVGDPGAQALNRPLGGSVSSNGSIHPVAWIDPQDWLGYESLTATELAGGRPETVGTVGIFVVEVEVTTGILEIGLLGGDGLGATFLSAIVVEPADSEASILATAAIPREEISIDDVQIADIQAALVEVANEVFAEVVAGELLPAAGGGLTSGAGGEVATQAGSEVVAQAFSEVVDAIVIPIEVIVEPPVASPN